MREGVESRWGKRQQVAAVCFLHTKPRVLNDSSTIPSLKVIYAVHFISTYIIALRLISHLFSSHCKIAKSDYLIRHTRLSVSLSVALSAWNNSAPTTRILTKFYI